MSDTRTVVFQCTDSQLDGQWHVIPAGPFVEAVVPPNTPIRIVPTGSVQWCGDAAAEVWVPEYALDLWRAEHDLDSGGDHQGDPQ